MKTNTLSTLTLSAVLALSANAKTADLDIIQPAGTLTNDTGEAVDLFGSALAQRGSTVLIGAKSEDQLASDMGAAYLMNSETGALIAKLTPSDGEHFDYFGKSVALNQTTAIVGSPHDNTDNGVDSGSAYLFDAQTGLELLKLEAGDGEAMDQFGRSVGISGTTAIVGAWGDDTINGIDSGSAYLFDTTTGAQIAKLLPEDGESNSYFGWTVGISGAIAIVGHASPTDEGDWIESAYLFDVTTGTQIGKLSAADGEIGDSFGRCVSISGTTAIVGAPDDDDNGTSSGSAYIFDALTGTQLAKLVPTDNAQSDRFGSSVAIHGSLAAVGAPLNKGGALQTSLSRGAIYLYHVASASVLAKLQSDPSEASFRLGTAVSLSGETAVGGQGLWDLTSGTPALAFDLQAGPPGTKYCFGDDTGAACPCGNTGGLGEGCANSTGVGSTLSAVSTASVTDNAFGLMASGLPIGPGLYFQGDNMTNSGDGVTFGDGLRCAGGNVKRIEVRPSTQGLSRTTADIKAIGEVVAGDTKHYQLWYRDPFGSPCGSGFNLSNGLKITFWP
jgi:hypothetical protein